jgi:unsaturated rhamnogalacturonyl hydrolase
VKSYRIFAALVGLVGLTGSALFRAAAQPPPLSERAANAAIVRWPNGRFVPDDTREARNYELGALLEGMDAVWMNSADGRYFNYIKDSVDQLVGADGSIPTWKPEGNQLDNLLLGRQLLLLYRVTQEQRYATAATLLYQQLVHQTRDASEGSSHKQKHPNQIGFDALDRTGPFHAEYASTFHRPEAFAEISHQFKLTDENAREFRAWDVAGHMMALVDTLDSYPEDDAGRSQLIASLQSDAAVVARRQDDASGLWYQALDTRAAQRNYLEASASCMFVYSLAKGVRRGYLPLSYLGNAERGYRGILDRFIHTGTGENISIGNYENDSGQQTVPDDPTGVGMFLMASTEMENAANISHGRGDTVLVDAWFNSQKRADATGRQVSFHYKWDDLSNSGYSFLGHIFRNFGAETETLYQAPTRAALNRAQVYVIVSPDIPAKNPSPHYMQPEDAAQIAEWVKAGGVLVLMENDPANADLEHLNLLAEHFGIHFNNVLRNRVDGDRFEMGKVAIEPGGPIFQHAHTAYMKDVCTISVQSPSVSVLRDHGDVLMATAQYGKGTVFATVDPWVYNEYTDGRKLPAEYDNYAAGEELVRWILEQVPGH